MLILLTHANHLYSDPKQVRKMQPYPPLQTLVAASVLREAGFRVAFFDATFDNDFRAAMNRFQPGLVAVCEDNFNYLTKMCLLENRALAQSMARVAGECGVPAIVNSSDASDHPEDYLAAGFASVIRGELESALVNVCRGGPSITPIRAPIADLDRIPEPAWDLLDIQAYRQAWRDAHGYFAMSLVTSRGCPYRCNWCAKPIYGSNYRCVSAARAAREMASVKRRFAPDRLWYADDIFGLSGKWAREFADAVEALDASIPFKIQSRCDLMTRDTVDALARAGCAEVWMGAESGSQQVLDRMDKGIRVEHIYQARENLARHGIRAGLFLQFGYLGEEWDDIEATIRMVRAVKPDDIGVSVSYPLPNTRFYEIVQDTLGPKTNWRDSGDLAIMFRGAFSSDFYRALADALHKEVRGGASSGELAKAWNQVEQMRCACC
jgi:anaerobic magnesium-protoporphyrin IX monomethyl ester cyclase